MIRISALNEEESDEDSNGFDTELIVTKEAEETIAISEYVRALQMKNENKQQAALELLLELLDTQVIHDVSSTQADNKLFAVKYNCYRNIGLIYEEQGKEHLAIEFLMKAMDLDETDVYTMSRLAHMALKTDHLQISKMYYEKCLKRNPNHWPSMEGLLRVFCSASNVVEAYGWASQCHRKDSRNKLYVDVLRAIRERFKSTLPYLDTVFVVPPSFDFTEEEKHRPLTLALETFDELFKPRQPAYDPPDLTVMPERLKNVMKVDDLSFETIGNVLVKLNQLMEELDLKCVFMVDTDELFCVHQKEKPEQMEEDVQMAPDATDACAADVSTAKEENRMETEEDEVCGEEVNDVGAATVKCNDETNGNGNSAADSADSGVDANEQAKNKARRRGSELKILEQWGWHKNRRSTRKKSLQEVNDPVDATVDSFLKQAVKQHLSEDSRFKDSPFMMEERKVPQSEQLGEAQPTDPLEGSMLPTTTQMDFCRECNLHNFVAEMKESDIDVYALMYGFLAHVSKSWGVAMNPELRTLYLEVHSHFVQYTDYDAWNQLAEDRLEVIFQITLFHLELKLDAGLARSNERTESMFNQFDEEVFHRCRFYVDSLPNLQTVTVYRIRLLWIAYILDCSMQKYDEASDNLYLLSELVEAPGSARIELSFPNQRANTNISGSSVRELIGETERKLRIERVKRHYDNGEHEPVVAILKDTLQYYTSVGNPNESILSLTIQTQMLLESLWSMAEMEECFLWSERSFTYSVQQFMTAPVQHDSRKSRMWANNINFALLYIESIIKQEGVSIIDILGINLSRLIQSLHRMLMHQLDPSGEKNYTAQLCLIECWRAWIVLYYILERQDDMDSLVKLNRTPAFADQSGALELEPERLCNSIMMCFVAHELLGKKNWCSKGDSGLLFHTLDVVVPKIRSPMLEPFREILNEYLEQVTYCLYGYPQKRPRLRHIQDHCAVQVSLTWERAIQLFDLYRPDNLPEFNSYKLESISTDMEALLQRIILLIPSKISILKLSRPISEFIDGKGNTLPEAANILQSEVKPIFYLLADFYFKSRDFTRAIRYYVMDLALEPSRFDSWAGISLSKASKVETKLNSTETIPLQEFLDETDNGMKCFDQCLQLNEEDSQLWIEYGSFAYNIHSFCSRSLKLLSDTLSMESFALVETHKERCLDIAFTCFNKVSLTKLAAGDVIDEQQLQSNQTNGHNHEDEIWLHHYMLGKIAEKKKEHPAVYLTHYLKSAKYLYECNATYPIKINHSSPSQLAIEALEVFYRINAAIIKYVEQHSPINKKTSRLFLRTLKELSTSPFAVNRAKINENMLKRKISPNGGSGNNGHAVGATEIDTAVSSPKASKPGEQMTTESAIVTPSDVASLEENKARAQPDVTATVSPTIPESKPGTSETLAVDDANVPSPSSASGQMPGRMLEHLRVEEIKQLGDPQQPSVRRGSQESAITSTTTTTTTTTSTSSSSSDSSDSDTDSSSDSDSDSTSTDDELINQQPISPAQRDTIFKLCIKNLEECITRFPEHYKSMYRLIHHFMHAPGTTKSFESARQLLLGTYRTTLGNQIPGLFTERKTSNFFNGLWRIPASDIDRPGNFASHISKCVIVLMETLKEFSEHDILLELAMQLQRTPEPDKKYLNDYERKELVQQAILFCVQVYRSVLKKYTDGRNDTELLSLMVDMYKAYRKIIKHMQAKEPMFATVLIDAYRVFVSDKVSKLPDNVSLLDLAVKLCMYEMNYRKTQEKQQHANGSAGTGATSSTTGNGGNGPKPMLTSGELPATMIVPMQPISANFIPGLTKQNRRLGVTKSSAASTTTTSTMATNDQSIGQQHGYPPPPHHPFAQTTMNSMMSDLSSRVTITPIMLDGASSSVSGTNSSKVTASTPMSSSTIVSTAATKPLAFSSISTNELLLPLTSGSAKPLPSVTPPTQLSTPAVAGTLNSSTLYEQYLKLFSQIPNIASLSSNPMMTAALTEYLAALKMQTHAAALSPSADRSTSTPSPLPAMSLGLPKGMVSSGGKEYSPASNQQPTNTHVTGGKKASATKATASSTITSMNSDQHQQLATITLTPMSTLTGAPAMSAKKDIRVSSPFGGTSQRVSSPSPILTITPSDGPMPAHLKDPPGGRKVKGRKAGTAGQQTRPAPYSRPIPTHQPTIPQLGVPGLSIEPVMGPLMQPMGGKSSGPPTNTGRVDKSLPAGMFDAGVPKDMLASYMELLQKYPHMARSLLTGMKGTGASSSTVGGTARQTGGRKQSAKQSNKPSTMTMQAAMANMPPTGSVGGNRFSSSPTSIPRISATITPVLSGGYPTDNYNRQSSMVAGGSAGSSAQMSFHPIGVGSNQQQAKTLQQKLAERQKANKARETEGAGVANQGSSTNKPKPVDDPLDVIVLE